MPRPFFCYPPILCEDKREVKLVWNGKTGEVCGAGSFGDSASKSLDRHATNKELCVLFPERHVLPSPMLLLDFKKTDVGPLFCGVIQTPGISGQKNRRAVVILGHLRRVGILELF